MYYKKEVKYVKKLQIRMKELLVGGLCIAFSGGVDSSLLLKIACEEAKAIGEKVYAVTFSTRLHPMADLEIAQRVAKEFGAEHVVIVVDELTNETILNNPVDRCYHCKKMLFQSLVDFAKEKGITHIVEGTNYDDMFVYRPGIKAVKKLQVNSPLAELEITKEQVREFAKALGISVAKRPSTPCMATRLPYNTQLDFEVLERIDKGETILKELGFAVNRLRLHKDIARIEVKPEEFEKFITCREEIIKKLKELGFLYITLDLEGFRSGSFDSNLKA